ncbi:MAG: UDP binding domain-containing protein, partial [Polyangiaceae bacterium]
ELSRLCHATGADVHAVRLGIGSDTRIGKRFLYAGPGYGGSCFPKDVQALMHLGRSHGVPMRLAEATHLANAEQATFLAQLVEQAVGTLVGCTIALWGLAFKPETDDIRESPALKLAEVLLASGSTIVAHDPEAGRNFARAMAQHGDRVRIVDRDYDALNGAQALVLLTEWRSYRAPNFAEIRRRLRPADDGGPAVVVDARNIWRAQDVAHAGLRYQGIGVPRAHD